MGVQTLAATEGVMLEISTDKDARNPQTNLFVAPLIVWPLSKPPF
jgi:hypothetical protein